MRQPDRCVSRFSLFAGGAFWLALLTAFSTGEMAAQVAPTEAERQAVEENLLLRTFEEQGGRSHASGERPELGPLHMQAFATRAVRIIRVGLSPTLFAADGSVLQEYHTAAAHHHDRVEITATGGLEVGDQASGALVFSGSAQGVSFVKTADRSAIAVAGPDGPLGAFMGPLRIRPAEGSILVVSSMRRINRLSGFQLTPAPYRDELEVLSSTADLTRLRLVNVVELENYVPGVVVNESLSTFHVEALKTQAIAARGYAVANIGRFASRGFDIDDSTLSQVYRGQSSDTAVALAASRETEGLVVTREGRIVSTLYSSSMGGHTESNEYVFPFPPGAYPGANADPSLRGVHDGTEPPPLDLSTEEGVLTFYSTVYPTSHEVHPTTGAPLTSLHRWTRTRTAAELLARLRESFGVPLEARTITDTRTTIRGASGRMMQVVVSGDWGSTVISGWSDLRRLATLAGVTPGGTTSSSAPNSPSAYVITRDAAAAVASVVFHGGGFGHNVGMSQYGTHGRALRGQTAHDILTGYYSGVEITTVPLVLSEESLEQTFVAPTGRAALVLDNRGLAGLSLEINGRQFFLRPARGEIVEADLTPFLVEGVNRIVYSPRFDAGGGAVARVRVERDGASMSGRGV